MHVPDHLIHNSAELLAGLSAAGALTAIAVDLRRRPTHRAEGTAVPTLLRDPERLGPQLATAALVFALQMVNFPVLPGTSGHLLGGALAVALIGPRRAALAVAAVVATQALVFADGGVGALGVNLWLIALVPVAVAAGVQWLMSTRGTRTPAPWWALAGAAAVAGPPVAALGFAGLHALAGTGTASGHVTSAMVGVHLAIGLGEAVLTVGVLTAVVQLPAAIGRRAPVAGALSTSTPGASHAGAPATSGVGQGSVWVAAFVGAAGLSLLASSAPDGLERVAADLGFAIAGPGSILSGAPLADYAVAGLQGPLSASLAGALGIAATCGIGALLVAATRGGRQGTAACGVGIGTGG